MRNDLTKIGAENCTATKDVIEAIQELYPKYDKYLHSKVVNGEQYGIQIRDDAYKMLGEKFGVKKKQKKSKDYHKLRHQVKCRITPNDYELIMEQIKQSDFDTMQDWLHSLIQSQVKGESND